MAIPASYTEAGLAKYMATVIGPSVAQTLEWSVAGDISTEPLEYTEAVNETLIELGEPDIATFTSFDQIKALRAVARWQVWRHARMTVADRYDESIGGGVSWKRSQLFQMLSDNERREMAAAMSFAAALGMVVQIVPPAEPDEPAEGEFG